jgi:hypothetical protein
MVVGLNAAAVVFKLGDGTTSTCTCTGACTGTKALHKEFSVKAGSRLVLVHNTLHQGQY